MTGDVMDLREEGRVPTSSLAWIKEASHTSNDFNMTKKNQYQLPASAVVHRKEGTVCKNTHVRNVDQTEV